VAENAGGTEGETRQANAKLGLTAKALYCEHNSELGPGNGPSGKCQWRSMKIFPGAIVVLLLGCIPSFAVLGQYENSVTTDQKSMRAQLHETARQGYSVKELGTADGRTVREFVSPAGLVFGVAWQGPTMPNLQELLGSYFEQLKQAPRARRQRGAPLVVRGKNFVLVSGGHMRSFHGAAYVPNLLPSGIMAEVVR
jgi:Protein of unknown function (DUF2844)